jgi:hypothetical protein
MEMPHAIVDHEASGSASSKDEAMARRRFQNPSPRREGNWWVLYYWQDDFVNGERSRRKKREKLAPATVKEREVQKIASELLRPTNQGLTLIGSATLFEEFVSSTYIPVVLETMAKSTQGRYEGIIRNYLNRSSQDSLSQRLRR